MGQKNNKRLCKIHKLSHILLSKKCYGEKNKFEAHNKRGVAHTLFLKGSQDKTHGSEISNSINTPGIITASWYSHT